MALWLYATLDSVGSAREVARLTEESDPYRWICGGVSVNYHTLADFRSQTGETFSQLLTESLASLMSAGVVDLESVAQDGMRVRASAAIAQKLPKLPPGATVLGFNYDTGERYLSVEGYLPA